MPEENLPEKHSLPKGIIWGVIALVLIFVVSFGVSLYNKSKEVSGSVADNLGRLEQGVNDLKNLDADSAKSNFGAAGSGLNASGSVWQQLGSVFGGVGDLISGLGSITKEGTVLAEEIGFFENNLPDLLLNQRGNEIVSHLEIARNSLKNISAESDKLSAGVTKLKSVAPSVVDFYIPLKLDLARYETFLDSLIGWFKSDSSHHLLFMFQNPSEIRPAGGFLGSYADVTLDHANVTSADVHDINDATKDFSEKIIPPKPLQAEITGWRAADANWFFDFSRSAAQVLKFIEASKLYAVSSTTPHAGGGEGINFDGAIAVSPRVMGDLLEITGPIAVSSTRVVLDKDNFLLELQKIVEQGQASQATYPKKVLKELASGIFAKLQSLDAADKREFFSLALRWLKNRDIMLYFKDREFEKFFDYYGVSGKPYELAPDFEGDYLAVVDANVGGGKSDIFVDQTSTLESQINADGTVSNHLVIERKHNGAAGKYWWYKTPNLDYLQLFLSPTAELVNFRGGIEKNIAPPTNYAKNGYVADDYVAALEASTEKVFNYPAVSAHPESGKKVFATWSKIAVGEKAQIIFDYKTRLYLPPSDGLRYQFVFEKQAGTARRYSFTISAPVGFIFRETDSPAYTYEADDLTSPAGGLPGRLIIDLTLEKM